MARPPATHAPTGLARTSLWGAFAASLALGFAGTVWAFYSPPPDRPRPAAFPMNPTRPLLPAVAKPSKGIVAPPSGSPPMMKTGGKKGSLLPLRPVTSKPQPTSSPPHREAPPVLPARSLSR